MRRFRLVLVLIILLLAYWGIVGPFTNYMGHKPYAEKLGLVPRPQVLKVLFADHKELVGASILTRVFLYFGSLVETAGVNKLKFAADYPAMSRAVHTALLLDPYNMDGYYFGQSILSWDVGQHQLANELLEYGMKYRSWDWQLPFFAGFNYAYFLNDYQSAAKMYVRSGQISGNALFKQLAGRYLQEAGKTQMAIDYLTTMERKTRNPAVKEALKTRILAFQQVAIVEKSIDFFVMELKRQPVSIEELITTGYLISIPVDPYGGKFYLDQEHKVRSTSKFSFVK